MALTVRCLWHTQVHSSAISSLAVSPSANELYCSYEDHENLKDGGKRVLRLGTEDGEILNTIALPGSSKVCKLWVDPSSSRLFSCQVDGTLAAMKTPCSDELSVVTQIPLKTVKPNSRPASATAAIPATPSPPMSALLSTLPEFCKSQGYRGPKQGYLYREGTLGNGYYRNDVLKKYTNSAVGEEAAAAKSQSSNHGLRCCITDITSTKWIATASDNPNDGCISVTSPSKGHHELATLRGHSAGVLSLYLSPNGSLLFSGSYDQTIRVWDTSSWACIKVLKGHGGGIRAMAVSEDGQYLYSAAADNTVRAWSIGSWVCLRLMHGRHEDTTWPNCMALLMPSSPHNEAIPVLVTGSTGIFSASTLKAFNPSTGECLATFAHLGYDQRGSITAIEFSSNGTVLYSAASDGTVAAWELKWHHSNTKNTLKKGFLS